MPYNSYTFQQICGGECGGKMTKRKLTSQFLNSNLESGRYYDDGGAGLNLHVRNSGSKNWSQKIRFQGKQYELGLGSFPMVSLAEARSIAAQNKSNVGKGINPKFEASAPKTIPTFSEISKLVVTLKHNELSNEKHKAQWSSTLVRYAYPILANIPVNLITVDHVLQALEPIWLTKNVTARRTRSRIEAVLNYAIVKKYMPAPNPAVWQGNLSALLPSLPTDPGTNHMPALQLKDVQRWWLELQNRNGTGANALKLLILTGARSGEVRGMTWDEIHFFNEEETQRRGYLGIWQIPARRMKSRRDHRVPLTHEMIRLIRGNNKRDGLIFPSSKGTPISDMTMSALMKRMHKSDDIGFVDAKSNKPAVPHGLRSTFRDWVAENNQSREAAELQLAHKFGSALEHTYYRTDLIDQRAKLLDNWIQFLKNVNAGWD